MTPAQKLALGIEIVAAMKASAYNVSIEIGRAYALDGTEPHLISDEESKFLKENKEKYWDRHILRCKRDKEILHKQALFVADIALAKIELITK